MNKIENARAEFNRIGELSKANASDIETLKAKIRGADDHNMAETEARAAAIISGMEDRPQIALLKPSELNDELAELEATGQAIKAALENARDDLRAAQDNHKQTLKVAAHNMLQARGMNGHGKFSYQTIADLKVSELLELAALQSIRASHTFTFTDFIADKVQDERIDVRQSAKASALASLEFE